MDLQTHQNVISEWVSSCKTDEQLDLLEDVVRNFIVDRFRGKATQTDIDFSVSTLQNEIGTQRKMVTLNTSSEAICATQDRT